MRGRQGLFFICKPETVWECRADRKTWYDKRAGDRTVHPGQRGPCINELLEKVGKSKFITVLELSSVLAACPGTRDQGADNILNSL